MRQDWTDELVHRANGMPLSVIESISGGTIMATTPIAALINRITHNAAAALAKGHPAVVQLARRGGRAVGPVLKAMHREVPPGQHATDVVEALASVLNEIAKRDATPLVQVLQRNGAPADPQLLMVASALGFGRKDQVVEPLIGALHHPESVVRWSAALSLVQLRSKKAVGPLTAALQDRSPMVYGAVVQAMHGGKFYRNAAAIEPLRRIVQRQSVRKNLPGLWRDAQAVLTNLEASSSRGDREDAH